MDFDPGANLISALDANRSVAAAAEVVMAKRRRSGAAAKSAENTTRALSIRPSPSPSRNQARETWMGTYQV
jgi:hypothetical protein